MIIETKLQVLSNTRTIEEAKSRYLGKVVEFTQKDIYGEEKRVTQGRVCGIIKSPVSNITPIGGHDIFFGCIGFVLDSGEEVMINTYRDFALRIKE